MRRVAVIASLLVLGATAGIAVDRLVQFHTRGALIRFSELHNDPVAVIERAFDLDPEQRSRITAIIERRQADVDAAWQQARRHIGVTVDSVVNEIAAVLDSADRPRFRALADSLHTTGHVRLRHLNPAAK
jgi:hypothetical protein